MDDAASLPLDHWGEGKHHVHGARPAAAAARADDDAGRDDAAALAAVRAWAGRCRGDVVAMLASAAELLPGLRDLEPLGDDPDDRAVRKAYHRVARRCHPDKLPPGAPDRALAAYVFSALTDAREAWRGRG